MAHKEEIQHQILMRMNPALLALSETRLLIDIEDKEVNVPGYSLVRCDAENRNTGKVMLYIRNDIKFEKILTKKVVANCWCIAVEVKDNIYKGVIAVVYHSPSASDDDFIRFLEDVVDLLIVKGQCIMIGDFNIDFMTNSFYAKKIRMEMANLGMMQYVDKPTRVTKDSKTLIDLVFANHKLNCNVHDRSKITDHSWISVELYVKIKSDKYRKCTSRDYSKFQIDEFIKVIEERIEYKCDLDVNVRAESFVQNIVKALDVVAPKKKFKIPRMWEGKKWYSDDITVATKKRDEISGIANSAQIRSNSTTA